MKLPIVSTPFDWAFVPLSAIKHLIKTDFVEYFMLENLEPSKDGSKVVDRDSGLLIQHYFGRNEQRRMTRELIERDYEKLRSPFLRRADHMRRLLSSPGPHLYVWLTSHHWYPGLKARQAACELRDTIRQLHPSHAFELLFVEFEDWREPEWSEPGIHSRYVPLTDRNWIGNDAAWDTMLADFRFEPTQEAWHHPTAERQFAEEDARR